MRFNFDAAAVEGCVCSTRGPGHVFCGFTTHPNPTRAVAERARSYVDVPARRGIAARPLAASLTSRSRMLIMAAGAIATARACWRASFAAADYADRQFFRALAHERTRMAAALRAEAKAAIA